MMHWREWIPTTLKQLREGQGYSLKTVAEKSELSISYISDIERGRTIPTIETLDKLLQVYGLTMTLSCLDGTYTPPGFVYVKRETLMTLAAVVMEITPKE